MGATLSNAQPPPPPPSATTDKTKGRHALARWAERESARSRPLTTWGAGVLAPPVLFALDRGMFGFPGQDIVPFRPYTTIFVAASIVVLLVWMAMRRRETWMHAILAGPLFAGGVFAWCLGCLLFPLAVVGTFLDGTGLLGFIPLWTGIAFLRAAALSYANSQRSVAAGPARALAALAILVLGMGVVGSGRVAQMVENRATQVVTGEHPGDTERAELVLRVLWVFPQITLDRLLDKAEAAARRGDGALLKSCDRITGGNRPVHVD